MVLELLTLAVATPAPKAEEVKVEKTTTEEAKEAPKAA